MSYIFSWLSRPIYDDVSDILKDLQKLDMCLNKLKTYYIDPSCHLTIQQWKKTLQQQIVDLLLKYIEKLEEIFILEKKFMNKFLLKVKDHCWTQDFLERIKACIENYVCIIKLRGKAGQTSEFDVNMDDQVIMQQNYIQF